MSKRVWLSDDEIRVLVRLLQPHKADAPYLFNKLVWAETGLKSFKPKSSMFSEDS